MQLVSPAGNLPGLTAAADAGAAAVCLGFGNPTHARAFPSLNFSEKGECSGIASAHRRSRKVPVALNTCRHRRGCGNGRRRWTAPQIPAPTPASPPMRACPPARRGRMRSLTGFCSATAQAAPCGYDKADGNRRVRLNSVLLDTYAPGAAAGSATVCTGRCAAGSEVFPPLEAPTSLNTLPLPSRQQATGVAALKIEGRQRSRAYIAATAVWRQAIDRRRRDADGWQVQAQWSAALACCARSFTARAPDLAGNPCGFRRIGQPHGMPLHTRAGLLFLAIDGVQMQGTEPCGLLPEWPPHAAAGMALQWLYPQQRGTGAVSRVDTARRGAPAAPARLQRRLRQQPAGHAAVVMPAAATAPCAVFAGRLRLAAFSSAPGAPQ